MDIHFTMVNIYNTPVYMQLSITLKILKMIYYGKDMALYSLMGSFRIA